MARYYHRRRDNYEDAGEAWQDVLDRTTVESFDSVIENAHTATHYRWKVEDA